MFSHLHVHTEYSKLDGLGRISELLERCKELGQKALAVTDHGTCSGLWELVKLAPKYDVKPILGCEFYLDLSEFGDNKRSHLILLAKNNKGLENIYKLHEWSFVHGHKTRPTITMNVLQQYSSDVVCMSACIVNIIPRMILEGKWDIAYNFAKRFKEMFGEDFYLEVQSNTISEQVIANKGLQKLGYQLGIQLVATNDIHYPLKSDAEVHEVLLAIQTQKKMNDPKRWCFSTQDFWLKSEEEMLRDLSGLTKEEQATAIANTQVVVDKCNATIERGNYLPKFHTIPKNDTEEKMLRRLVTQRYKEEIIKKGLHTQDYQKAVMHELDVIERNGYSGYHMIVQDFVNYARNNGIPVGDGRGSGAGCKVAYITGITRVEPNQYGLLFERFLADGREPDYDIDFADNEQIFSYLQEKYGVPNVARIVAFGTLATKNVTRRVFSTFDHPQSLISRIAGCIPKDCKTIGTALKGSEELRDFKSKYITEFKMIERLEGRVCSLSQHAGGIIIYPNLSNFLPLHTDSSDRNKRIVSFDMDMLHDLGHFKFDCLGLKSLTTILDVLNFIEEDTGNCVHLDTIDYEDSKVYKSLCEGKVTGCFQIENQCGKVVEQQPQNFRDLIAINALIRPGTGNWEEYIARRNGKEWTCHPERMWYMEETLGLITYQEQFLLDCKTFAGWDIAFADAKVRKNKNIRNDVELEEKFYKDTVNKGYDLDLAKEIWAEIMDAVDGGYSFNKSHATAYAVITYRTAWLKYYYPQYFYSALMTRKTDDADADIKLGNLIGICKQENVAILPPDINKSLDNFIPTKEGILYSLTAIKGLGSSAIEEVIRLRPIKSFHDMYERRSKKALRSNNIEALICSGVFDNEQPNRADLLNEFYKLEKSKKYEETKWCADLKMEYEHKAFGVYISKHPLEKYGFKSIQEYKDKDYCLIAGNVLKVSEILDKKGNKMAFITVSNQYETIKCLAFSSYWNDKKKCNHEDFKEGNIVMIKGKRSGNDCLINTIEVLDYYEG